MVDLSTPKKPKNMHWKTFIKLVNDERDAYQQWITLSFNQLKPEERHGFELADFFL